MSVGTTGITNASTGAGAVILNDASGNGPITMIGPNDSIILSNGATGQKMSMTNGILTVNTFLATGAGQGFINLSNAGGTASTVILGPSNVLANATTASNTFELQKDLLTTNNPGTSGQVLTSAGAGKAPYWNTGGASQTPWTSDINGGGFRLTNAILPLVSPSGFTIIGRAGARVLLNEDIMTQTYGTAPATIALSKDASSPYASGLADVDTNHLGISLVTCATNSSSYGDLQGRNGAVVFSGADWYIEYSIRFTNSESYFPLSNGWFRVGWTDIRSDGTPNNGAWGQLKNSSNVWSLVTSQGGTRTTNFSNTIGTTNVWQTVGVYSPYPNTNAILYVNGAPVVTNTANMPAGVSQATGVRMGYGASALGLGSSTAGVYVDYIWMAISPNSWP